MSANEFERKLERAQFLALILFSAALPVSITLMQASLAVLIFLAALKAWKTRSWQPRATDFALAGFLVWTSITAFTSLHPEISMKKLPGFWIHLAWFALISAIVTKEQLMTVFKTVAVSSAVMGLYGLLQHLFGPAVPRPLAVPVDLWQPAGGYYHAVGLFDHHLTFGNNMVLCFSLGLAFLFWGTWRKRFPVIPLLLSTFLGIVFSYARAAWIGFGMLLAAFSWLKGRKIFIATAAAGMALIIAASAASPSLRDRIGSSMKFMGNMERIYLWKTSLEMASDHPIFGIGPGVYRKVVESYREGYNVKWTTASHAHNSFLMAATESGWPAFCLFIAVIVSILYKPLEILLRLDRLSFDFAVLAALISGLVGFVLASLFQHNFGDAEVAMAFWMVAAATARYGDFLTQKGEMVRHDR